MAGKPSGNTAPSTSGLNGPQGDAKVVAGGRKKIYAIRGTTFEVDPQYDVIKAIGLGAYGLVCSAKDNEKGTFVAIKKIPKLFDDLIDGKRVLRELKIMRYLRKHPNLVQLIEVMRPHVETPQEKASFSDVYVVAELMDTDLHLVLKSKQKLNFEHHSYFMYQLIKGVAYMHSAGVIHRDLKPGNLLVNGNCDLKICDFGLARGGVPFMRKLDDASQLPNQDPNAPLPHELTDYVITRWYRPPELLLMAPYHHAVDLWSVGCIVAEVLLRKALFQGRDYMSQLELIAEVVEVPRTEEELGRVIPALGPEQSKYMLKAARKVVVADRPTGDALTATKERLFKKFGFSQDRCSNTWNKVMDLIARLIAFDPAERLTASQALRHAYFAHIFNAKDDVDHRALHGPEPQFQWEFDQRELGEADLRDLFWGEMTMKVEPATEPEE